jgi:aspartokinase
MADLCTWITFRAHPLGFDEDEDFHPDFFGTFVCPESREEPESLLKEVLANQNLALIDIRSKQRKSKGDVWGMNERLKRPLEDQGFGIALVKVQAPAHED